ncbi:radical SAM protein [Streptomyces sp. 2231.1]|uniref:radical SAM protein n=1 Tax=Streptomyces sp. 2231.1 TaxID=1855347 RepID=UPI001160019C|nr:radical SAM protein [Streptomyces sp. 2231.1]
MTADNRPDLLLMSGGEAMLRPSLVRSIAEHARLIGTRTNVLSGLFFANHPRIPAAVRAAIDAVDHFSASMDVFHEREVPRKATFKVLSQLLDEGKDVSLQVVGLGPEDPYLADLVKDVRSTFDDRIPMFVGSVAPQGRARTWLKRSAQPHRAVQPAPCSLAAWPVVGFNGHVTVCGNQDVMDGIVPMPPHLLLGNIAVDDWETVKERCLSSSMVRALRTMGPRYLAQSFGGRVCSGYCETCFTLSDDPSVPAQVSNAAREPRTRALEVATDLITAGAGPVAFARQWGIAKFAELVLLGLPHKEQAQCGT